MHKIDDVRHHHSEPEHLLGEGTEWVVGRSIESVGLMYSADCGLVDSRTRGLRTGNIYCWNTLFFANTLHV